MSCKLKACSSPMSDAKVVHNEKTTKYLGPGTLLVGEVPENAKITPLKSQKTDGRSTRAPFYSQGCPGRSSIHIKHPYRAASKIHVLQCTHESETRYPGAAQRGTSWSFTRSRACG